MSGTWIVIFLDLRDIPRFRTEVFEDVDGRPFVFPTMEDAASAARAAAPDGWAFDAIDVGGVEDPSDRSAPWSLR